MTSVAPPVSSDWDMSQMSEMSSFPLHENDFKQSLTMSVVSENVLKNELEKSVPVKNDSQ